jgi:hypothetical protein
MGMGIALILAENERLRAALTERDQTLAERDQTLTERERAITERDAKIAALTASNEDLAMQLNLIRIKISERRNQRYVEGADVPLPFMFAELAPPPRLPQPEVPEPLEPLEPPEPKAPPRTPRARRDLSQRKDRPIRKVSCVIDPASACAKCGYLANAS